MKKAKLILALIQTILAVILLVMMLIHGDKAYLIGMMTALVVIDLLNLLFVFLSYKRDQKKKQK